MSSDTRNHIANHHFGVVSSPIREDSALRQKRIEKSRLTLADHRVRSWTQKAILVIPTRDLQHALKTVPKILVVDQPPDSVLVRRSSAGNYISGAVRQHHVLTTGAVRATIAAAPARRDNSGWFGNCSSSKIDLR